jgi:hypothetical protein
MKIMIFVATIYFSMVGTIQVWNVTLSLWDPFFYRSVVVLTPQVKRGELLVMKLDVQRYRVCKVEIDRFIVNDNTKQVIYRERVPGGATLVGRTPDVRNVVRIPADAELGPITIIQNVHSHCIDGMHSMAWPVLRAEIVE